jgi:hypothetical protein
MFHIYLSVILTFCGSLVLAEVDSTYYCADLFEGSGSDSSGTFSMKIDEHGYSMYAYDLTLSASACTDMSQGLTYHIHSTPITNTGTCSQAGGHYDPYLACGAATQETGNCSALNRNAASGWNYAGNCPIPTPARTVYNNGTGGCEVGDLSGKFGVALPTTNGGSTFQSSDILQDSIPALLTNFYTSNNRAQMWSSFVFHCNDNGARVACGNFVLTDEDATGTNCPAFTSTGWDLESCTSNDDDDFCFLDIPVAGGVVFMFFSILGLCCLVYLIYIKVIATINGDKESSLLGSQSL